VKCPYCGKWEGEPKDFSEHYSRCEKVAYYNPGVTVLTQAKSKNGAGSIPESMKELARFIESVALDEVRGEEEYVEGARKARLMGLESVARVFDALARDERQHKAILDKLLSQL